MRHLSFLMGKRTIKTALSVLVTAMICQLLNWPAIFAVLAAIVSIEPTVHASLQKAKIRLPAAAVGAAFAMLFVWILGQSPLSYALSVLFTIAVCHKLHWDDAIVVAALTSFNMLVLTEDHFLMNFFIRLGTTSLGIIVSVIVNYLVFPPYFIGTINKLTVELYASVKAHIDDVLTWHLEQSGNDIKIKAEFEKLLKKVEKAEQLVKYQATEFHYRRIKLQEYRRLRQLRLRVELLRKLLFLAGIMINTDHSMPSHIDESVKMLLYKAWGDLKENFDLKNTSVSLCFKEELLALIQGETESQQDVNIFDAVSTIAYSLLSMHTALVAVADKTKPAANKS